MKPSLFSVDSAHSRESCFGKWRRNGASSRVRRDESSSRIPSGSRGGPSGFTEPRPSDMGEPAQFSLNGRRRSPAHWACGAAWKRASLAWKRPRVQISARPPVRDEWRQHLIESHFLQESKICFFSCQSKIPLCTFLWLDSG